MQSIHQTSPASADGSHVHLLGSEEQSTKAAARLGKKTVRILVVDDHDIVRRGLKQLLTARPGWEVCGEAKTGREAVALAQQLKPEIVVMDIGMPELNGLEAARQIRKGLPNTEIVILSLHLSDELVYEIVQAGVRGYVLKSDSNRDLVNAVEALSLHR